MTTFPPEFQGFPAGLRLRHAREFRAVFDRRRSVSDATIILYGLTNDLGHPRLGLSVSRKYGRAHERNRFKRLCREAFRLTRSQLPALDLIIIPRGRQRATLEGLRAALPHLTGQLLRRLDRERGTNP